MLYYIMQTNNTSSTVMFFVILVDNGSRSVNNLNPNVLIDDS